MATSVLRRNEPITPTERDVRKIHDLERCIAELQFVHNGEVFDIPDSIRKLLQQAISIMAVGDGIGIVPLQQELTSQQAADLLNVSRPYLVKLLEEGKMPFRKVGAHRRIRLSDVLAYKEEQDHAMKEGLKDIAAFIQLAGSYR